MMVVDFSFEGGNGDAVCESKRQDQGTLFGVLFAQRAKTTRRCLLCRFFVFTSTSKGDRIDE